MTEKNLVIDALELDYEGLFDLHDFLAKVDHVVSEKGYVKKEKRRKEEVFPSGKELSIELRPTKRKTPDLWLSVKMRISITGIQDVSVIREKRKVKMQKGKINIIFDAWVYTSTEHKWEAPWHMFFKKLIQKAFTLTHVVTPPEIGEVSEDCHYFYDNIRAYLNMYKYDKEKE